MNRNLKARLRRRALAGAVLAALVAAVPAALASSHREAPAITETPKLDGTDLYVFRSYEPGRQNYVTFIANYVPLQDAYGGPNYFTLDPDGYYDINIDNNGDARENITFRFRFKYDIRDIALDVGGSHVSIPLRNAGQVGAGNTGALNDTESYTVEVLRGNGNAPMTSSRFVKNAADGSRTFVKPIDNIGFKSIPDYAAYAASYVYDVNIPNCSAPGRLFVGQRREGFAVDLGEIFDLVNIPVERVIGSRSGSSSASQYKNITSLAIEVPIACVTQGSQPVIGVWTTASSTRRNDGDHATDATDNAGARQVSRLGMPLVNEIVIGLKDKDRFNASKPKDDGQFATYVTNPTLPALLELLFGSAGVQAPTVFPRVDLVAAFLTGVPGVNKPANVVPSEMTRLNTALPVTPKGSQNSLGALDCFVDGALTLGNAGCDPAGFPNGRRPGDDVVDVELRVAMGALLPPGPGKPASASLPYTDGALVEDSQFDDAFPYLTTPIPGSPNGENGVPPNPAD
ncbi:MAG TPA: DUF4331 domain-containing protein [Rhodanobacteraceae bacterium]|nr:DUF4331 domain-containing protein [Rhodanobacteraceae bacterium]